MTIIKSNWKNYKIKDISIAVSAGATPSTKISEYWDNGTIPWMSSGEVNNEIINTTDKLITQLGFDNSSTKIIPKNSVLIALAGQGKTRGKVAINKIELCTNQSLASIIPNDKVHYKYLYYNLQYRYLELRELSSGDGGRGGLNLRLINNIKINLPPVNEQKIISEILETVDKEINIYHQLIKKYNLYKNSIIQKFSLDIKGTYPSIKIKLKDVLIERNEKSKGKEEVHSVSVNKGVVNQIEHLSRVYAAKNTSKYNLVKFGDIIYTKSPTGDFPYGIIKQSYKNDDVIVSPLYGVYEPKSFIIGKYLNAYFDSPTRTKNTLTPIIEKGPKNTMNITNKKFLEGIIKIPQDEKTINDIANAIGSIEENIRVYENLLKVTKRQKKGLMQQLLTGKIRVNTD